MVMTRGAVLEGRGGVAWSCQQRWGVTSRHKVMAAAVAKVATAVMAATTGYQCGPPPVPLFGTDVAAWETLLKMSDAPAKSAPPSDTREWYPFNVQWHCVVLCQHHHCKYDPPDTKEGMFPSAVPWGHHCQKCFTFFGERDLDSTQWICILLINLFSPAPIQLLKNHVRHVDILQIPIVSVSNVSMSMIIMFCSFVVVMENYSYCIILSIFLINLYFITQTCSTALAEYAYFHLRTPSCNC
jgi:hypothetical protein